MEQYYTGAFVHVKTGQEYTYPKVGMAVMPVEWNNPTSALRKAEATGQTLEIENQFTSYSCGGNLEYVATLLEFLQTGKIVRKSRRFIYEHSYIKGGGASLPALGGTFKIHGSCSEVLCPSYKPDGTADEDFYEHTSISQDAYNDGSNCLAECYAEINNRSIEAIAQGIRDEGVVFIGIYGYNNGTWLTTYPQRPLVPINECWAHWVVAVDYLIINGLKYIKVANSWDKVIGDKGYQYINEDYFTSGYVWCSAVFTEKVKVNIPPFKYIFNNDLKQGDQNNDVMALQKILKLEGYVQRLTGYFWEQTLDNVKALQLKYKDKILTPAGLKQPTGYVGSFTRNFLNKKYG